MHSKIMPVLENMAIRDKCSDRRLTGHASAMYSVVQVTAPVIISISIYDQLTIIIIVIMVR